MRKVSDYFAECKNANVICFDGPKKDRWFVGLLSESKWMSLCPLASDSPGELDVFGHDGDPLGVDGTEVGVLKEADEVSLRGFLEGHDSRGLEAEVSLEVLGNLTDETLEGELPDEELSALLVTTDLTEGDGTGPVTMGLLDTSCSRS